MYHTGDADMPVRRSLSARSEYGYAVCLRLTVLVKGVPHATATADFLTLS